MECCIKNLSKSFDRINIANSATKSFLEGMLKGERSKESEDVYNLDELEKGEEIMKNIRRRKDGRWEYRKMEKGNEISIIKPTIRKLQLAIEEYKTEHLQLEYKKDKSLESFYEYSKKWFRLYKEPSISKKTASTYNLVINNYIKKIDRPINRLTLDLLQDFLNKLPSTRIKEHVYNIMCQIIRRAYVDKKIKEDFSLYLEKGKIQHGKRESLTIAEQKTLIESLDYNNNKFDLCILTYLLTGVRPAELFTIKPKDISEKYIHVHGEKTKNADRYVRISKAFYEILKHNNFQIYDCKWRAFETRFKRAKEERGFNFTLYQLRHTFASNLFHLKYEIKIVQMSMGHATSAITNDVYIHLDPNITKEDIEAIYGDLYKYDI